VDAPAKVFRAERAARRESVCHAEDGFGIVRLAINDE
jgi:hypothetical protein